MAGAYLFHVSQAHGFIDGNKRAALAAALAFVGFVATGVAGYQ
jgi:prophage maintenance system killer protein